MLTVEDLERRLALGRTSIFKLLSSPADDPWHLPSVMMQDGRRGVREADLERLSTPAPLPADAVGPSEAIEVLAGKRLKPRSTSWVRHRNRLDAHLTAYVLFGNSRLRRYSRADVLALKVDLEDGGITPSSRKRVPRAVVRKLERESGLVGVKTAAVIAGVAENTARSWRGYGGRRIAGQRFFVRAEVEQRGESERVTPEGREERLFDRGRALREQWDSGKRDRVKAAERMRATMTELHTDPERHAALVSKATETRYGAPLSAEKLHVRKSKAHGRRSMGKHNPESDGFKRSDGSRKLKAKVTDLWKTTEKTQTVIATECSTTQQYVSQIVRNLPPRQQQRAGRPRNYKKAAVRPRGLSR